jgi:RNA polymerase-binding transcription factor DksA
MAKNPTAKSSTQPAKRDKTVAVKPVKKIPAKAVANKVATPSASNALKASKVLLKKAEGKPTSKIVVKNNKPLAGTQKLAAKGIKGNSKVVAEKVDAKASAGKSGTPKTTPVKNIPPKKAASNPALPSKKEKVVSKKTPARTEEAAATASGRVLAQQFVKEPSANKNLKLTPFFSRQRQRLLELKDTLLDSMSGVARGNLHAGSETSAFGMHQADAGSDAYDRDFALSMLSKEQGSLYEIDEALKRIEYGTYGVCEICEKPIRRDRLEALPFTRYTVECQAELEKRQHHHSVRPHINSLFGLTEEEVENEEEETTEPT